MDEKISIISGPSSSQLADNIASYLNMEAVSVNLHIFSDGESKIRIMKNLENKTCVIIQSIYPPTDRHLLQLLMIAEKCTDDGAARVLAVAPYMGYARQDKAFLDGEIISIAVVAKLLKGCGISGLITVEVHSMRALSYFTMSVQNISSVPLLACYTEKILKLDNPLIVSPDHGGIKRAEEFAKILKADMISLEKYRDRNTGEIRVEETNKLDYRIIEGRDAILVDDIISTGGTVIKACELLRKNKSNKVYAMCTHALFTSEAAQKMKAAGIEEIIATNSIPNEFARVDLTPIICSILNTV
jgi:ribose-phosphate pyrophosphokinase